MFSEWVCIRCMVIDVCIVNISPVARMHSRETRASGILYIFSVTWCYSQLDMSEIELH